MTDSHAGFCEQLKLAGRIIDARVTAHEDHVTKDGSRAENAGFRQILDDWFAMAIEDLEKLPKIAAGVNMDRYVQLFGRGSAFLQ
jgi:hypothetical protein